MNIEIKFDIFFITTFLIILDNKSNKIIKYDLLIEIRYAILVV